MAIRKTLVVCLGIACLLLITLGIEVFAAQSRQTLEVDFFDIGQGDAIFIQTPTHQRILIDGGKDRRVSQKIAEELPLGERRIDAVILTHPDLDHVGGLPDVMRRYSVGALFFSGIERNLSAYQELKRRVQEHNVPLQYVKSGDVLRLASDLDIIFLAPTDDNIQEEDLNNSSIVAKLRYNKRSFLFTGDAAKKSEDRMLEEFERVLASDILKVGHHGSRFSSSQRFLDTVGALAGVISAGAQNSYGHPHREVLERMARAGMTVYRTDLQGDIEMISDGTFITITSDY